MPKRTLENMVSAIQSADMARVNSFLRVSEELIEDIADEMLPETPVILTPEKVHALLTEYGTNLLQAQHEWMLSYEAPSRRKPRRR